MIRRPPRSTQSRSSAASDVYKRQRRKGLRVGGVDGRAAFRITSGQIEEDGGWVDDDAVSYTHLRAHETVLDLVCRLLLEKKNKTKKLDVQQHDCIHTQVKL